MASALRQQPASELAVVRVRAALFLICLLPLARLVLAGTTGWFGGLGANPVELITRSTGTWTLVLLCCTLAVTPLRRFTGWNRLIRLRRMLGLYTFFYGVLHLMTWVWFDRFFDLTDMANDLVKRPFVAMGMFAFILMVPLAVTSTQAMIRRLGRRWVVLHRLVYLTAVAAILHYLWHKAGKNDFTQVSVYAAVIAVLLATRLIPRRRAGPTAPTSSRAA